MALLQNPRHFVMFPLMAPGHILPMIDMAKLFAKHGITITIIVTPLDAARFAPAVHRAGGGLPSSTIHLRQIPFPCREAGLPPGCESADVLPSYNLMRRFLDAIQMLQQPLEGILESLDFSPGCIVCDKYIPWMADTCHKFRIPRIIFDGMNCFTQLVSHSLHLTGIHEKVPPTEGFVVPGLPDRVEFTRLQLPGLFNPGPDDWTDLRKKVEEAEPQAYGMVVNSFEELEKKYVDEYRKLKGGKVWCIGPLSLDSDRGASQVSIDSDPCLKWLDDRDPGSVIYACLGSLCRISASQFIELATGLENSNHAFILVVKEPSNSGEIEKWILENGIEERTKGRGMFIRGWAPQVMILSHPTVGGFLTHCGWNSTLEGISAGLPMATWPMFAEQFLNEKLVVEILGTGVSVGAQAVVHIREVESKEMQVSRVGIEAAVRRLMDGDDRDEEARRRRRRAAEMGELARKAVEDGGSSCLNITKMIEDIEELVGEKYG